MRVYVETVAKNLNHVIVADTWDEVFEQIRVTPIRMTILDECGCTSCDEPVTKDPTNPTWTCLCDKCYDEQADLADEILDEIEGEEAIAQVAQEHQDIKDELSKVEEKLMQTVRPQLDVMVERKNIPGLMSLIAKMPKYSRATRRVFQAVLEVQQEIEK